MEEIAQPPRRMPRSKDRFGFMPANPVWKSNPCYECGTLTKGRHHVVPVIKGGTKVIPLCSPCHHKVHNMADTFHPQMIKDGLEKARARGVKLGAPKKINDELIIKVKDFRKNGKSFLWIAKELGCGVGTVHSASMRKDPRRNDSPDPETSGSGSPS